MLLRLCIFLLLTAENVVELVEYSSYRLISDHVCDVALMQDDFNAARSKISCVVACKLMNLGSGFCFDKKTGTCTCCLGNSHATASSNLSVGSNTTLCYTICPSGWTLVNNTCFLTHPTGISFDACKSLCEDSGGKVLILRNRDQTNDALSFIENNEGPKDFYWLGVVANTTGVDKPWYYSDTGDGVSFYNWMTSPNEPNGVQELCVAGLLGGGLKWTDSACGINLSCVCQI